MNILDSIILGIVEGVTEFLPISSTGHMILTSHLMHLNDQFVDTFEVVIQLGAILAVVVLYASRFKMLLKPSEDHAFSGLRGLLLLMVTSFPAAFLGLVLHKKIETYLFGPGPVLAALVVGAVAIILVERQVFRHSVRSLDDIGFKQALMIGCFQCFALWPGMSRSASTIIGGLFSGLERNVAAEYSFIAAVPIMVMATGYSLVKSLDLLQGYNLMVLAVGFVTAFVSAILAIKFFIRLLQRWTLVPFGIYRIGLAIVMFFVFQATGW